MLAGFTDAKKGASCVFADIDSTYDIVVITCDLIVDAIFFTDIVIGFTQARWRVCTGVCPSVAVLRSRVLRFLH